MADAGGRCGLNGNGLVICLHGDCTCSVGGAEAKAYDALSNADGKVALLIVGVIWACSCFEGTFANPILTTEPDISRPFKSFRALIASLRCIKLTKPQFLCV